VSKILVVEDDPQLCKLIRDWLALEHHNVEVVEDGKEAIERLKIYEYDLIILDWNLPNVTGIEVLKEFRNRGGNTPVLMLTGRGTISDKESGFDAGADDYLTKPFHGKELTARLRALLRRPASYVGDVLKFGNLVLDRENYRVMRNEEELRLVPKEFALLEFLMRNPNRVFAPEALLNRVWATESDATVDALTTCIKRLRKKIDIDGQQSIIRTVHGVGYKLELPQ
jgi:DNA-binding response OmpR family regulator